MLSHWSNNVGIKDLSGDKSWGEHLTKVEARKFCRVQRVITVYTDQVNIQDRDKKDVLFQFET